jgi:L-ornithine Nalpha-acyltransferase
MTFRPAGKNGHASGLGTPTGLEPQRAGALEVRLATTAADIDAAQALRYRVFYEEMSARPTPEMAARQRDFDSYDPFCDHLLVIDHRRGPGPDSVVATYRLLRRAGAALHGGFYTASEFDIEALLNSPGEILELGRSCVAADSRNGPTMQMLWRGLSGYVFHYDIKIMFGCASLPGTDPAALALPLSYLYHYHLAPPLLRTRALPGRYVDMNMLPPAKIDAAEAVAQLDARTALAALPPLIKGYLRVGGLVGDGAVIDPQFNTTDVCIIVVSDKVTEKYFRHYRREIGMAAP